jgi:hypothetical protein
VGKCCESSRALGVPSRDFRFLVRTTPALAAVADEASEIFCDKAEGILREALESENEARRDVASRFVLSGRGAQRGWSRPSGPAVTLEQPRRRIILEWEDGTDIGKMMVPGSSVPLIDARPVDGDEPDNI